MARNAVHAGMAGKTGLIVARWHSSFVHVPISVDTYKAGVADRAVDAGATIVNDISALTYDPALAGVVARRGTAVILMHNRGRSTAMFWRRPR